MNIQPKDTFLYRLVCLAACIAFCVVILGAYTRLKDAGLGCPDWPGCYGHVIVPHGTATPAFGSVKIEPIKAWAEMSHRYLAGTLGVLILILLARVCMTYKRYQTPVGLPMIIGLLVLLQASLGRFTVTLKLLPPVVMFHLLGGMTLTVLLVLLALRLGGFFANMHNTDCKRFKYWTIFGLLLLIVQITLGGWTSANYASLACTDFPYCHGALLPTLQFDHAFTLLDKIGINYQGGILDEATRITILMTHRLGAMIVAGYWLLLCLVMLGTARSKILLRFILIILFLLSLQVILGILNLVLMLPLPIAVSHNAVAALLCIVIVSLNYAFYAKKN